MASRLAGLIPSLKASSLRVTAESAFPDCKQEVRLVRTAGILQGADIPILIRSPDSLIREEVTDTGI